MFNSLRLSRLGMALRFVAGLGMVLLAVSVFLSPGNAAGATFLNAGPTFFGDDNHSATLNPYPAIAVSTIANPPGQCTWINTGLNNFITANPANGSGPTGQGWSYSWAGVATEAKVEAGINILDYFPYVVNQPAVTGANGTVFPGTGPGEFGGAVINLSYTPTDANGAPVLNNINWIQALTGTLRGNPTGGGTPILDNGPAYMSQNNNTNPYYGGTGFSSGNYLDPVTGNNDGYFLDTPLTNENEYELNPVASVQFQVVLSTDTTSVVGGITQNALTLYGGEWWGFSYSAVDVPEPSAWLLLTLGGCGFLFFRRPLVKRAG
jgi:hypothetical protein